MKWKISSLIWVKKKYSNMHCYRVNISAKFLSSCLMVLAMIITSFTLTMFRRYKVRCWVDFFGFNFYCTTYTLIKGEFARVEFPASKRPLLPVFVHNAVWLCWLFHCCTTVHHWWCWYEQRWCLENCSIHRKESWIEYQHHSGYFLHSCNQYLQESITIC